MKKGFGWVFIVLGILNFFRGFIMINQGADNAGGIFIFAIIFLAFGMWMVSSNKPKKVEHDDENTSQNSNENQSMNISEGVSNEEMIPLDESKIAFKKDIEREFYEVIADTINQTRDYDNTTIRISVHSVIKATSKTLKKSDYTATGLTRQETDKIIDEISERMLN
jgi:hypothetical protein